jgi:hypothetical protein
MDSALRCLRDGVVNGRSAPFVLLQDSSDVLGGPAVAAKVLTASIDPDKCRYYSRKLHTLTWHLLLVLCMAYAECATAINVNPCIRHVATML